LAKEAEWWATHHHCLDPCPKGRAECSCGYSEDTRYEKEATLVSLVKTLFDSKDEGSSLVKSRQKDEDPYPY